MAIHFLFKAHPVATAHMYRVKRDRPHQSLHILKNVAATLDTTGSKLDLILMVFDDKMTLFNSLNGSIAYRVCNNMTLQSSFKKGDPSPETLIKKKITIVRSHRSFRKLGILCPSYFTSTF